MHGTEIRGFACAAARGQVDLALAGVDSTAARAHHLVRERSGTGAEGRLRARVRVRQVVVRPGVVTGGRSGG
ncbi:hypothetical protein [Streptosporangium sp. LJ11]|uniref:hypothetical protein n=1 Tax=Streptosporangium sp. LJ11 TaxID=3436927 RepID=UPI003F7A4D05